MDSKTLRIALTLALAAGSTPAWALGLGQIEIKSKLSQPLLAEIPIIAAIPNELEDLSVRLASPDAFARVGLSRPSVLTANLQFTISKNDRGQPVVRITTSNRVDEPYLSFLVEADWGNGSIVREYTALLDPPYIAPAIIKPLEAPIVAQQTPPPVEPIAEPEPEPEAPSQSLAEAVAEIPASEVPATPPATEPSNPEPTPAPIEPPPLATTEPAATAEPVSEPPAEPVAAEPSLPPPVEPASEPVAPPPPPPIASTPSEPSAPIDSYQVNEGDTLSQITNGLQAQSGASTAQIMLAIQRANPDAFIRDNINLLRKGAVLRIPGRDEIATLGAAEARQLVQQQMDTWRSWRQPALQPAESAVAQTPATPSPPTQTSSPTDASQPRLEIVPPAADGAVGTQSGASAGGTGEDLRTELTLKEEELAKRDNEIAELKSRLAEQETLAEERQKLIELKESALSELQTALQNQDQNQPTPEPARPMPADPAAQQPAQPEPLAAEPAQPWYTNPLILGGGALLAIGGVLAIALRRKRPTKVALGGSHERLSDSVDFAKALGAAKATVDDNDSSIAIGSNQVDDTNQADSSIRKPELTAGWPTTSDNPSAQSPARNIDELAKAWHSPTTAAAPQASVPLTSTTHAFDNPLTERLRNLRDQNLKNLDTHLALIRHLYQIGDKPAFEQAAGEMKQRVVDPSGPHWREVVVMGMGLLPDNPLFREVRWNPIDVPPGGKRKPAAAVADPESVAVAASQAGSADLDVVKAKDLLAFEDPAIAYAPSEKARHLITDMASSDASSHASSSSTPVKSRINHDDDPPLEDPPLEDPDDELSLEETKLELARAYLDIGDVDGAREMLEEIVAEGGPDTQAQARRLLSEIG